MITSKLRKLFPRALWRRAVSVALVLLLAQTVLFVLTYRAAGEHLRHNDPRQLQNRAEVSFFYAPPKLRVGAHEKREALIAYLRELDYAERDDNTPASYFVKGETLNLTPRAPSFQTLSITFADERISRISVAGEAHEEAELEPLPMQNFVRYLKDDSLAEQRVRRTVMTAGSVPAMLSDAVTSAEDRRFFEHHGIDVFGIAWRVANRKGGGSSITQQLLKSTIFKGAKQEFWQEYLAFLPDSWQRKATDVFFALAAEKLMTKDEIMAAYLSVVPLGAADGVEMHGVVTAAQEYLGKSPSELSLAECAELAGMIHQPSFYLGQVRQGDESALLARRNYILDLIGRNHPEKYSDDVIEQAKAEPVHLLSASRSRAQLPAESYSRQFVSLAAKSLPLELAQLRTTEGSSKVFTTLDFNLQQDATQFAEASVRDLQTRVARACLQQEANKAINKATAKDVCASLKPQAALVALDAQTGAVLALVGGVESEFNYATARRSPASAIKPFFYLKAIENGIYLGQPFTAATLIDPRTDDVRGYRPTENLGRRSSARVGLMKSYNFHAVAAAQAAGLEQTIAFVGELTASQPEVTGMAALGGAKGSETSLLDLTQAYGIFPNNGQFIPARFHQSFTQDQARNSLTTAQPKQVASAAAAFILTNMMLSVVSAQGTAPNFHRQAGLLPFEEVAAKTGSGMIADMWFIACTPRLIVGVWTGLPNNEIKLDLNAGFSGGNLASPLAAKFLRSVRQHRPELLKGAFQQPGGVSRRKINSRIGCATDEGDAEEYFIADREPAPCQKR
jgi:membrane peptidoglycan carboxypeptidase